MDLQREVFDVLRQAGISVYLAGNKDVNVQKQKWPDTDPNGFWREGAVTVSPVMQAKGNEADVVYLVGVGHVAAREDSIKLRNQLFVSISRSRGWVHLSGTGMAGKLLTSEIERVIAAGPTLQFTYRQPRRQLDGAFDKEVAHRICRAERSSYKDLALLLLAADVRTAQSLLADVPVASLLRLATHDG